MKQSRNTGRFRTIAPPENGGEMFNILWEPALCILDFHMRYAAHPKVLDRVSQGLITLAKIAHCYEIRSAFNSLIHTICNNLMSNLLCFGYKNHSFANMDISPPLPLHLQRQFDEDDDWNDLGTGNINGGIANSGDVSGGGGSMGKGVASGVGGGGSGNVGGAGYQQLSLEVRITFILRIFFGLVSNHGKLLILVFCFFLYFFFNCFFVNLKMKK